LLSDNAVVVSEVTRRSSTYCYHDAHGYSEKSLNASVIVKEACSILGGSGGGALSERKEAALTQKR